MDQAFAAICVIAFVALLGLLVLTLTHDDNTQALSDHRIDRTGLIGDIPQDGAGVAGAETPGLPTVPGDSACITAAVGGTNELLFDRQQPRLDCPAGAASDTVCEHEATTTQAQTGRALELFVGQQRIKAGLKTRIDQAQAQREALP
jgi:hypothetical protein